MTLAAAFSDLHVEYVDGVTEVEEKTLPPGGKEKGLSKERLNSWRVHLNVLRRIVEQNLTSALILEDDADWDLRIKSQMQDFARASRLLIQPLPGTPDKFLDPTCPESAPGQKAEHFEVGKHFTTDPTTSPYGDIDRWDLLWLGHCGIRFPRVSDEKVPLGRAVIPDDETVPQPQHIHAQYGNDDLVHEHPAHTRFVSRVRAGTCSLGYAVSQPGARRLLYELGVHRLSDTFDISLRSICDGVDGRKLRTCLTVQPQLFQHHRPNEQAFTTNIRWSTRLNFPKLVDGETDYIDLFKDGEQRVDRESD
ncbi:Glycosyltransferase family 25 [Neofusicoccum parvum]|nr:Glycosyltransferase family 25 [Neofusicoccum parvum]